ncbi:hypothetical protein [Accumulibacter sp.]|uniref:hypothetical protein n=1 Tax=Accumulibacter sp. TaxID=2053492 RepID=UPI0025D73846|nr:hypothetical protein [Accumulibacter sp.]MCM8594721.1 hypothetical protein [Accumulibacter sp.]MCM8625863.1 hypothetical protein [Accumulibacter sp.]MDS4048867.1 hypothetical protein [Accumulibacter sp.]
MRRRTLPATRRQEEGVALLAVLTLLGLAGLYLLLGQLNAASYQAAREESAGRALVEARDALVGEAISDARVAYAGVFLLPDIGVRIATPDEGYASGTPPGASRDYSVAGKIPWKSLDISAPRDRSGECLWYVLSGRFRSDVRTLVFNWDTRGQLMIFDAAGNLLADNVAALVVAPGPALGSQDRRRADPDDPKYSECGDNYDARNYLDPFDAASAIAGRVNYFPGSNGNRVASDAGDKEFVVGANDSYNDSFLYITADELFDRLIRRSDFAVAVSKLLDDPDLRQQVETGRTQTVAVSAGPGKGTDNLDCAQVKAADVRVFCTNWKEMLFLTQLPVASPITIDGLQTGACVRVLIFAGRRTAGQIRVAPTDRVNPANYLEGANLTSFRVPVAAASSFAGWSQFDARYPERDLVRCLP